MTFLTYFFWGIVLLPTACLCFMCWLYISQSRRLFQVERDNMRLIRRIGQYHSLPLTTPYDTLPQPPPETPVPPAFRKLQPTPSMSITDQLRVRK